MDADLAKAIKWLGTSMMVSAAILAAGLHFSLSRQTERRMAAQNSAVTQIANAVSRIAMRPRVPQTQSLTLKTTNPLKVAPLKIELVEAGN